MPSKQPTKVSSKKNTTATTTATTTTTKPSKYKLDFYLYSPAAESPIHMGTVYRAMMLIAGFSSLLFSAPFYAWLALLFYLASCFNQPLPHGYKYPISNALFPLLLLILVYNMGENGNGNPINILFDWNFAKK